MSTPTVKTSLMPVDDGIKVVRVGSEYQVDALPAANGTYECQHGDGAAADHAKLIWAPFDRVASACASCPGDGGDGGAGRAAGMAGRSVPLIDPLAHEQAAYLRQWAAVELQENALEELFKAQGDVAAADASMRELQEASGLRRLPQAELTRSAALGAAIIAHRKDFYRARCSLTSAGVAISIGQLQHFFYGQFRISSENKLLSLAKKAEHQDDGYDDYCELCGLGGFLICCDQCSAVYHLRCANLDAVPTDDWLCPRCTSTKGQPPLSNLGPAPPAPPSGGAGGPTASGQGGAAAATGATAAGAGNSSSVAGASGTKAHSGGATSAAAPPPGASASLAPLLPSARELPRMSVSELQRIARGMQLDTSTVLEKSELVDRIEAMRHTVTACAGPAGYPANGSPNAAFATGHVPEACEAHAGPPRGVSGKGSRGRVRGSPVEEKELPPLWQCEARVTPRGRHYKKYFGPNGGKAQSHKNAWKVHNQLMAGEKPKASRRKRARSETAGDSSGSEEVALLPSSHDSPSTPPQPAAAKKAPHAKAATASARPQGLAAAVQLQSPGQLGSAASELPVRAAPYENVVKMAPERIFHTNDGEAYTADSEWGENAVRQGC